MSGSVLSLNPLAAADQMCQTGLAFRSPFLIDAVIIADQNAVPLFDQSLEGFF